MPDDGAQLYGEDLVRWSERQAAALRAAAHSGINLAIDWENVAEEIESLGTSQRSELRSRLLTILEHLLKLEHSPAADPRRGWITTVGRERTEIEAVLDDSPSLRREVGQMMAWCAPRAARLVARELSGRLEGTASIAPPNYTEEQVLGDWFPGAAAAAPHPLPPPASGKREGPASAGG